MAGAVIENLSSRKLFVILIGLIIVEIAVTLIGGLYGKFLCMVEISSLFCFVG